MALTFLFHIGLMMREVESVEVASKTRERDLKSKK